jgi:serine/threonine protein kinase
MFGFLHNESINIDWHIRLKLSVDIALGMAFLHGISPPLLHRDLKSPNVLIMGHADGSPVIAKVADFGLSSRLFVDQLHGRPVENPTWWYV